MVAKTRTHKALCFPPKDCISYLKMLWECAVHLEGFEIWGGGRGQTERIMEDLKMEHSPFSLDVTSALMESVNNKKRHLGHLGVQILVTWGLKAFLI